MLLHTESPKTTISWIICVAVFSTLHFAKRFSGLLSNAEFCAEFDGRIRFIVQCWRVEILTPQVLLGRFIKRKPRSPKRVKTRFSRFKTHFACFGRGRAFPDFRPHTILGLACFFPGVVRCPDSDSGLCFSWKCDPRPEIILAVLMVGGCWWVGCICS